MIRGKTIMIDNNTTDNKEIFCKSYIEVTIPVGIDGDALLRERYPETLKNLDYCLDNEAVETCGMDMKIAFDLDNKKTHFYIITECFYKEKSGWGYGDTWIETDLAGDFKFDKETADYFKRKAIRHLLDSVDEMSACVNRFEE